MANDLPTKLAAKICESCGAEFGCGAKLAGCWCAELTLTESAAADIRVKFNDCLCRSCLEKLAAKPAMKITYPDGTTEVIENAVRVDTQNFHEGMYDFYGRGGNLLRQISMSSDISWEEINENKWKQTDHCDGSRHPPFVRSFWPAACYGCRRRYASAGGD